MNNGLRLQENKCLPSTENKVSERHLKNTVESPTALLNAEKALVTRKAHMLVHDRTTEHGAMCSYQICVKNAQ